MEIVIGILLGIFALCAILLVLIVLVQDDGADGAGMIFGSAASQQYGVRKGNIVTKTTSVLAASFLILAFTLAFLLKTTDNTLELEKASQEQDGTDSTVQWWKDVESGEDEDGNTNNANSDANSGTDTNNGVISVTTPAVTPDTSDTTKE